MSTIAEIEEIESDNEKESTLTGGKRKRRGGRLDLSSEHIFSLVLVSNYYFCFNFPDSREDYCEMQTRNLRLISHYPEMMAHH